MAKGGYTKALGERICAKIAEGMTTRQVCALDGMPNRATLFRWLAAHPKFREQYDEAREVQLESMADELLEIADDATHDLKTVTKNGEDIQVVDHEYINRSKLRVDTRKWLLSKRLPKKYGDRQQMELTGADGKPLTTTPPDITINFASATQGDK